MEPAWAAVTWTFTEQAAVRHFGGAAVTVPASSLEEVLREVEARQADFAVVPVENSTEGAVGRALDLLSRSPLEAVGEVRLRIVHHLMGRGPVGVGAGPAVRRVFEREGLALPWV